MMEFHNGSNIYWRRHGRPNYLFGYDADLLVAVICAGVVVAVGLKKAL